MSFSLYLLQVNLYLIIFYCFYKALLSKETYFRLNRLYLIASGILSLLIPVIKIDWLSAQAVSRQVQASVNWSEVIAKAGTIIENPIELAWTKWIAYFYFAGVAFFVFKLVYNLAVARRFMQSDQAGVAYSFFQKKNIDRQLPLSDIINVHEEAHIKQWHSIDILFLEIISAFNWFNPVLYAYRKEIKNVHEFLADEAAAGYHGDKSEYALLLLSKAMGVAPNKLLNGFIGKSVLKERIFMLHKERSKKLATLKYGVFLPVFCLLIMVSSAFIRENKKLKEVALTVPITVPFEKEIQILAKEVVQGAIKPVRKIEKSILLPVELSPETEGRDSVENVDRNAVTDKEAADPDNTVYDFVSIEKQPDFPGGISAFYSYISKNLKYPAEALENKVQGKVFLSFTVRRNGLLSDLKITRGLGSGTDEEALRVVGESPKWNPGMQNGKPVDVRYHITISFKLDNGEVYTKELPDHRPLLIIDNVVQSHRDSLAKIDIKTIAAVSILKSEQAVNIYGAKATNGVIIVTTKGYLSPDKKALD